MGALTKLENIGPISEKLLHQAGIDTEQQLRELGSKEAFMRMHLKDETVCLDMLYGLEGASQQVRWYRISDASKQELKAFFKAL